MTIFISRGKIVCFCRSAADTGETYSVKQENVAEREIQTPQEEFVYSETEEEMLEMTGDFSKIEFKKKKNDEFVNSMFAPQKLLLYRFPLKT